MQIVDPSPREFEEALDLIHRTAMAYEGPHAAAFAEIARCSRIERGRSDERDDAAEREHAPIQPREPREQFAEALSLLLKIAYPANQSDVARIIADLGEVLGEGVETLSMSHENDPIDLRETLRPAPEAQEREFEHALRRLFLRYE